MVASLLKIILLPKILSAMSTTAVHCATPHPQRFLKVDGYDGKKNDIIYHSSLDQSPTGIIMFFGGDVQDYTENMMSHRDNKAHVRWNLESTAVLLHNRFPTLDIFIVRPSRMQLKTFSCYENFVEGNDFGAPNHKISVDALKHLKLLLQNVISKNRLYSNTKRPTTDNSEMKSCSLINDNSGSSNKADLPISLIGFSKGCVVLNQLLYSFMALSDDPEPDVLDFVQRISVMYWLDGGHSGSCNTWVTNKPVLQNFSQLKIKTIIHVTPYQVHCDTRPRIGKEEKVFRETLRRFETNIQRTLHFEEEPRSFENHFRILETFQPVE